MLVRGISKTAEEESYSVVPKFYVPRVGMETGFFSDRLLLNLEDPFLTVVLNESYLAPIRLFLMTYVL